MKRIFTIPIKFKLHLKIYKLYFHLEIQNAQVAIKLKRKNHKIISNRHPINYNIANFHKQIISLQTTLFYDKKQKEYKQKMASITLLTYINGNEKKSGKIEFDIAKWALEHFQKKQQYFKDCDDKNARLVYQVFLEPDKNLQTISNYSRQGNDKTSTISQNDQIKKKSGFSHLNDQTNMKNGKSQQLTYHKQIDEQPTKEQEELKIQQKQDMINNSTYKVQDNGQSFLCVKQKCQYEKLILLITKQKQDYKHLAQQLNQQLQKLKKKQISNEQKQIDQYKKKIRQLQEENILLKTKAIESSRKCDEAMIQLDKLKQQNERGVKNELKLQRQKYQYLQQLQITKSKIIQLMQHALSFEDADLVQFIQGHFL